MAKTAKKMGANTSQEKERRNDIAVCLTILFILYQVHCINITWVEMLNFNKCHCPIRYFKWLKCSYSVFKICNLFQFLLVCKDSGRHNISVCIIMDALCCGCHCRYAFYSELYSEIMILNNNSLKVVACLKRNDGIQIETNLYTQRHVLDIELVLFLSFCVTMR